jgi:hypothetical protein
VADNDDNGRIRLFHTESAQVTDGLFLAGSHHVPQPVGQSDESAILRSEIALQAFDSSFWRLSCSDHEVVKNLIENFERVKCTPLVVHTPK